MSVQVKVLFTRNDGSPRYGKYTDRIKYYKCSTRPSMLYAGQEYTLPYIELNVSCNVSHERPNDIGEHDFSNVEIVDLQNQI